MMLSKYYRNKAYRVSEAIQEYLVETKKRNVKPKFFEELLKEKGLLSSEKRLRDLLRLLHENGSLELIPQASYRIGRNEYSKTGKVVNKWFFNPV